jgi:hypothetical protein
MRPKRASLRFMLSLGIASVAPITCVAQTPPPYRAGSLTRQDAQSIYAVDSQDSWNQIFYWLFTRTVKLRLADNFKEGAPFVSVTTTPVARRASARTFERIASGDRAIDPLYPSFFQSAGTESVLVDPQYQQFKRALQDALGQRAARPALQRALMQADAWAAFDHLDRNWGFKGEVRERANELLPRLAGFVRKLALTPEEVAVLPDTYAAAQRSQDLPLLFDESGGWIEVEWFPGREHDRSADDRRATRVFVKPKSKQFLDELNDLLRRNPGLSPDLRGQLDGVALVTEDLLVDSNGRVRCSPLIFEVQVRSFFTDSRGDYVGTKIAQYELNRKRLLGNPASGGLVRVSPDDPAYLPYAGNDYTFASPIVGQQTLTWPILASLQRRCEACHGEDVGAFFTFSIIRRPGSDSPPVRQLRSADDPHGAYVAQQKMERDDFKLLRAAQ